MVGLLGSISFGQQAGRRGTDAALAADDECARGTTQIQQIMHDPEGNQIELFVASPWYIEQPCRELIDLDRPNEEILAEGEAFCRAQPRFRPVEEWRAATAERIVAHDWV